MYHFMYISVCVWYTRFGVAMNSSTFGFQYFPIEKIYMETSAIYHLTIVNKDSELIHLDIRCRYKTQYFVLLYFYIK